MAERAAVFLPETDAPYSLEAVHRQVNLACVVFRLEASIKAGQNQLQPGTLLMVHGRNGSGPSI